MMKKSLFAVLLLCSFLLSAAEEMTPWEPSLLRPGDVLSISVFRLSEFDKSVRIEEDGKFHYPFCGEVQAAGLTARAVGKKLEEMLKDQVTNPQVDVFVSRWAPRRVYILGEVNTSSSLELPTTGAMTALQAISAAGGFTESADLNNVSVLRRSKDGKKLVRHPIDVSALVSRTSGGDDFRLQPEDTLIIPKAPPVYISGAVNKQSVLFIDTQRPPLLSEVIIRAGGLAHDADPDDINIVRVNSENENVLLKGSLVTIGDGEYQENVRLQPGDNVLVSTAQKIYVLGEVKKPGPIEVLPGRTVTASQAIALAGGFTDLSKQGDIVLIRDKQFSKLNLKKLFKDELSLERDIELRYGDVLFIKESFF